MPGSRRSLPRSQNPPNFANLSRLRAEQQASIPGTGCVADETSEPGAPLAALIVQPRHAHIPEIAVDGNLLFECMVFVYSVLTLGLQYINLYRTVWWLPHSNAKYALNFYLIDPYLTMLLVIIMGRRVIYCFVKEVYGGRSRRSCFFWLVQLLKLVLVCNIMVAFVYTAYRVILRHSLLYSLFLCYPLATYVILFGPNIRPLFGKTVQLSVISSSTTTTSTTTTPGSPVTPTPPTTSPSGAAANNTSTPGSSDKGTPKHKVREPGALVVKEMPVHNCTMSPEAVRDEVEVLKTDFNSRIKQVLFNSMMCAYYMGFVPLCFAQNTLYYDTWWVGQHVCLVWISSFVFFMVHFLPPKYVDVLHRCALHLGHWVKVEGRHAHIPYNAWSELQVWQQGALVKHVRGLFKAEGINNSAEPGNGTHSRFYFMFHPPLRVTNWLLIISWGLVLYQFFLLAQALEWSHILSLAMLLFCNYYILFKLMRDRFVLMRAYKDEMLTAPQ